MRSFLALALAALPAVFAVPATTTGWGTSTGGWGTTLPASSKPITKGCSTITHVTHHTGSRKHCVTQYGTTSVSVIETSTITTLSPVTQTIVGSVTTTVLSTVTPAVITSTITATATVIKTVTAVPSTSTFSTTIGTTLTVSTTTTIPVTQTLTSTVSTTSTCTSGVPTASGWLPIQDTTGSAWPARKRAMVDRSAASTTAWGLSAGGGKQWPTKVICSVLTTVTATSVTSTIVTLDSTTTVHATSTLGTTAYITLAPATTYVTVTNTVTSTSTVCPPTVTSTVTFTTTKTSTVSFTTQPTSTVTTTTTITFTATSTTYDACAPTNFLSSVTSGGKTYQINNVYNAGPNGATKFSTCALSSAYDCCVSCLGQPGCEGSGFTSGTCYYFSTPSGSNGKQSANPAYYHYNTGASGSGMSLANGNCGYLYNGGLGY